MLYQVQKIYIFFFKYVKHLRDEMTQCCSNVTLIAAGDLASL